MFGFEGLGLGLVLGFGFWVGKRVTKMNFNRFVGNLILSLNVIIFAVIAYFGITLTFVNDSSNQEKNQCLMSWMNPSYRLIPMNTKKEYPRKHASKSAYKLYLYQEGGNEKMEPFSGSLTDGIPLLFVPGNAGSFEQARSVGVGVISDVNKIPIYRDNYVYSMYESLKFFQGKYQKRIDVFTVDFHEELSAFHKDLVMDQAEFVNECIQKILSLYESKHSNVITVGHSMGGFVLRSAPLLPNYKEGSINTIISLATPQNNHPLVIDSSIADMYQQVNHFWNTEINSSLQTMSLLSISSGARDGLIRDDLTKLSFLPDTHALSVSLYDIPHVRVSSDHLSSVWCKQLLVQLSATILDLVHHPKNSPGTYDLNQRDRMVILENLLISRFSSNLGIADGHREILSLPDEFVVDASEEDVPLHALDQNFNNGLLNIDPPKNVVRVPIDESMKEKVIIISNLRRFQLEIKACDETKCKNLDRFIETLPYVKKGNYHQEVSYYQKKSQFFITLFNKSDLPDEFKYVYVILKHQSSLGSRIILQTFSEYPKYTRMDSVIDILLRRNENISFQSNNSIVHSITFPNLSKMVPYKAKLNPKCKGKNYLSSSVLVTGRKNGKFDQERLLSNGDESIPIVLFQADKHQDEGITLTYFVDAASGCDYELDLSISYIHLSGKLFQFLGSQMIGFMFAILLFIIGQQVKNDFKITIGQALNSFVLVKTIPLLLLLIVFGDWGNYIDMKINHSSEINFPKDSHYHTVFGLVVSYFASLAGIAAILVIGKVVLAVFSYIVFIFPAYIVFSMSKPNYFLWAVSWIFIDLALVSLTVVHAGVSIGLLIVVLFCYLGITYFDHPKRVKNLNFTLFSLSICAAGLFAPSCVLWIREYLEVLPNQRTIANAWNYLPSTVFVNDYRFYSIPLLVLVSLNLYRVKKDHCSRIDKRWIGWGIDIIAALTMIFCRFALYRMHYSLIVVEMLIGIWLIE